MAWYKCGGGGDIAQGFSLLHNSAANRFRTIVTTNLMTYSVKQITSGTISCDEFDVTVASASPYAATVKFLKAGYYRIQSTSSGTPTWVYKNVNDTISIANDTTNTFVQVFCFKDLKQH